MSAPARLILVRHAEIDCARNGNALLCGSHDAPLSDRGRAQVDLLRGRLAQEAGFTGLYTSPLRRAVDTARAAPESLCCSMRLVRSLAEIHCGDVEGVPLDEIRSTMPAEWQRNEAQVDDGFCWPGGETYRFFRKRVLRAVRTIAGLHAGESVLLVTHAGVINQILGSMCGQTAARWENFRPGNTAITEVLWNRQSGELVRFDDRSHLG